MTKSATETPVLLEVKRRGLRQAWKPEDSLESENFERMRKVRPLLIAFVALNVIRAARGDASRLIIFFGTVGLALAAVWVWARSGRLRVTDADFEIESLGRTTTRVSRSSIHSLVVAQFTEKGAYAPISDRVAILLDHGGQALATLSQRQWGAKALELVPEVLDVPVEREESTTIAALSRVYPGAFPWPRRHPALFATFVIIGVLVASIIALVTVPTLLG